MSDIELTGLTKRFGAFVAVKSINLMAKKGEMLTLLGPSGCGKTTTLRMIAGLEDPDDGTIRAGGKTIYDSSRRINIPSENRGLGMVFQSYAIWPHMTVFDNVAYPLKMRRVSRSESTELVTRILDVVGLGGYGDKPATKLSGGQQQRVAFARALVFEPELLLLDEPLSNLDAKLREHMRFELKTMKRTLGLTSIYVTHDQEEALTLSDRVVVMNGGRIEQIGTPEEIYEQPATRFVADFIGRANMVELTDSVEMNGGEARVTIPTYGQPIGLTIDARNVRRDPSEGRKPEAHLFFRPEKMTVERANGTVSGIAIPGRIKERAYMGDRNEYLVSVNDKTAVRAITPGGSNWAIGDEVQLVGTANDFVVYV